MSKNTSQQCTLTCSFGFDFKKRRNLVHVGENVVAYVVGNLVTFLDVTAGEKKYVRSVENGDIGFITVHPDGTHLVVGENGPSPRMHIYAYPSLDLENTIIGGAERAYSAGTFSSDGTMLASVSDLPDYWLTLWDWKTGVSILRAKTYGQEVYDVSFLRGETGHILTHGAGHVQFWQKVKTFTGWKLQDTLGKFNGEPLSNITGAVELPFKNMILTSTEYGALLIWVDGCAQFKIMRRSASGDAENCHIGSIETVCSVDSTLITSGEDGVIRKWSIDDIRHAVSSLNKGTILLQPLSEHRTDGGNIKHVCQLQNCLLIQDSGRGCVASWNQNQEKIILCAHSGSITGYVSSRNSTHLVTCDDRGAVHCYDYQSCLFLYKTQFSAAATALADVPLSIDESGRSVVVGFNDGVIRVLVRNSNAWRLALVLKPHSCAVAKFSWNPCGSVLAVSAADNTAFLLKSSRFADSLTFEPIGFLNVPSSEIFWESQCTLASQAHGAVELFDVPTEPISQEKRQTYKIEIDPRTRTRDLSNVEVFERDDTLAQWTTHDRSHDVTISTSGSFEVRKVGAVPTANSEPPIDTLCTMPLTPVDDFPSSTCASIEEVLQMSRSIESSENEVASSIRLLSFVELCREEFDSILRANRNLPEEEQMSNVELFVDEIPMKQVREESLHPLKAKLDRFQSSFLRAEGVTRQLHAKYFSKIASLPRVVRSREESWVCSSFMLRSVKEDSASTPTKTVCLNDRQQSLDVADTGETSPNKTTLQNTSNDFANMSSEARRRLERLQRTEELQKLKKMEPAQATCGDLGNTEETAKYQGFPLRCDPDSIVSHEERLTTEGKRCELESIKMQIHEAQKRFNGEFEKIHTRRNVEEDDIISVCYEKLKTIAHCKMAELSRLIIQQELEVMPEFDVRNAEMHHERDRVEEEVKQARDVLHNAQITLNNTKNELEQHQKVKMEIEEEFNKCTAPGIPRGTLLKVFHKRVHNKPQNNDEGDDSETDSDFDSNFEDESYYSSSDDEDGSVCPKGCDVSVYERICTLRDERIQVMNILADVQRDCDTKKKVVDSAANKLQSLEEKARNVEKSAKNFEKVKQQSLNDLTAAFVLPVSCVEMNDSNTNEMILFSKSRLHELESHISTWDAEVEKLKSQHQELKCEHSALVTQRSIKTTELQSLQQKFVDTQIRKFGQPIVLEDLDAVVSKSQSTEDLRNKLNSQEEENAQELQEIETEISNKERELILLIEEHTSCLNEQLSRNNYLARTTKIAAT